MQRAENAPPYLPEKYCRIRRQVSIPLFQVIDIDPASILRDR
jgi:hypothetical protein